MFKTPHFAAHIFFFKRHSHAGNLNSSWLTTGKLTKGQDDFRQITLETNSFHFCEPSASLAVTVIYIIKQDSWIISMFKIIYSNTQKTT